MNRFSQNTSLRQPALPPISTRTRAVPPASGLVVTLPGSAGKGTLPFLMYPNGENAEGRFDELSPDSFRYTISARELAAFLYTLR